MRRHIHNGSKPKLSRVAVSMLALLVAVQVFSPFHLATGGVSQNDPTACAPIGPDWTNCADAFSSNDLYALANDMAGSAVGSVTFPAQTVGTAYATNPTFAHNSPAGTDTIVIYTFAGDNGDEPTSVTYAGQALTNLVSFGGGGGGGSVTFPAQTVGSVYANNPTFAHNSPAGTDTIVIYTFAGDDGTEPTSVTYAGQALALLVESILANDVRSQIWYRVNPTSGTNDFVVSGGGGAAQHTGKTFHGVDQTNPFGSPANTNTATGGAGNPAVTITTSADQMTTEVNAFVEETGTDAQVDPTNGNSVEDADSGTANVQPRGVDSHTDTTGAITVGWTQVDDTAWAIATADLAPAIPPGQRVETWYRLNPTSGTNDFVVSGGGGGANSQHTGKTFHGVDQTNPFGSPANTNTATGGSGNPAVTITTSTDQMTTEVAAFTQETGTDAQVDPTNGNSVEDADSTDANPQPRGVDSHTDDNGAITVGWTQVDGTPWAIATADLAPAITVTPPSPGKNDTAWRNFGFAIDPSATITVVEIGIEWFRTSSEPILNVTISWDGGTTWATNQTATNKSADDNVVEFLDFTSATAWTAAKLNDANLRARVGTNASDARLDYVTVRVNSNLAPIISNFRIQQTGSVQTQRDPTACEAVGDNWTNCQDAFSSNNIYAYANDTPGGGGSAPVTVQAGAGADPTENSARKIFRSAGLTDDRYFAFYYSGTDLVWEADTDGTGDTWTGAQNAIFSGSPINPTDAPDSLAIRYDEGSQKIHAMSANQNAEVRFRRGTVNNGGTITWDFTDLVFGVGDPAEGAAQIFFGHDENGNADRVWLFHSFRDRFFAYFRSTVTKDDAGLGNSANWITQVTIAAGSQNIDFGSPQGFVTRATGDPRGVFYVTKDTEQILYRLEWSGATASTVWTRTEIATTVGSTDANRKLSGVDLGTTTHQTYLNPSNFPRYRSFDLSTGIESGEEAIDSTNTYEQVALSTDGTTLFLFARDSVGDIYLYKRDGTWGGRTLEVDEAAPTAAGSLGGDVEPRNNVISLLYANDAGANDDVRFAKFDIGAGPGMNDTAWRDFGFALGADVINTVEIGVEWFRNNTAPALTVTISWDGGATWAPSQTATNKSADDDTVQFLDFTSATQWTASKLNDTNLRARASTNASGARLDYTTARVGSIPSRAGSQLDVDTDYQYLFNVTDADGWSDIGTDGNVRLNLWYDGNGTPTIDQRDPTACAAIENDWTNCQDAFSSNNIYSYANETGSGGGAITFQRAGGSGQSNTHTIDIGTTGNDRLVVVYGGIETTGQGKLSDVTVDGKSANFIALAQNNDGAGSHTQVWAIDETALGTSSGTVTVILVGGTGSWGIHVQVFYGVASATAFDSAIDSTSVDPDNEVKPAVVDIPTNGLLVFLAGHGSTGTFNNTDWDTSPTEVADDGLSPEIEMTEATDGFGSGSPGGPFSAVMGTAYWISSESQQNNRQLRAQASINPFSRGSGVIASFSPAGSGGVAAFNYFDPVEVTPGTASAWTEVDASPYIPAGATGVILHITTSGGEAYGVRKNGSMDDRVRYGFAAQHIWAMIGVDANRTFEANVASTTNVDIWLLGYTGSGVTFITDAPDKSLSTLGSWIDIDISGDTGADTAIGAIIEVFDTSGNGDFGLRMNGSSDNRVLRQLAHPWAIVGVDANEILEGQITDLGDDFFLVGYVTAGAVFKMNADDVSLGSINTYIDIDISGLTGSNTANGAFIEVINANPGPGRDFALRKNGSAEDIFKETHEHTWGFVEVDGNEILEGKIDSTDVDFYLVGYSLAGSGGNDFKVQRGQVTIPTSQSTVTITAGTDYVAPASLLKAFIRIVGTFHSAPGDDTGQASPTPAQEWMTSISNPGNLLTSITFERYLASGTFTTRIYWEILEYTGPRGGANEMIVRDQADIEQTTGTQMDGASATVTDDSDVVVFTTGQRADGTSSGDTDRGLYTAEWVAASDLPRFTRGDGTGTASASYAIVEFTGSHWKVQRAEHTYVASGVEETETITAVNSVSRTFLHAQMRTAIGNVDEMGHRVHLSAVTTVSFQLRSGAGIFSQVGVAWVVENTQIGSDAVNVQRVTGTRTGGQPDPDEWTETISVVADLSATSIMGETSDTSGTGNSAPRGAIGLNLTAANTVTLWRTDGNNMQDYRFEVVEWPTAPTGGVAPGNDTAWRNFGFALSGSITQVEVGVEWFRNNTSPILNVTVSWDGGSTWATNQTATNKSADDNTLQFLDFTSATAWTPTKLNDANLRVRVGTNASGARLDYVTVRVTTSSGELTFSQQTTGANYRIVLTYLDTADPTTASLSEWSVTEGRATYNASASGLTAIMSGPTIIGYEFRLALKFGFQVKHAVAPINSTVGAYNDLDSWNGEVVATDGPHTITLQEASTGEHMEFGVFMYTFVNSSADWTVNVNHGSTANTNTITVFRRSNDDFTLRIWFVTDLIKGGDTIPITNVQILAAGDLTDDITADTAFAGLGEGNAVYILGSATLWFSHSTGTDEDTTTVQFSVTVAFGTPLGLYTAQLTIRIQQQPP